MTRFRISISNLNVSPTYFLFDSTGSFLNSSTSAATVFGLSWAQPDAMGKKRTDRASKLFMVGYLGGTSRGKVTVPGGISAILLELSYRGAGAGCQEKMSLSGPFA